MVTQMFSRSKAILVWLMMGYFSTAMQAQEIAKEKKNNPAGGPLFGGNMVQFYRNNGDMIAFPSKNPTYQWQVGMSLDAINTPHYSLRWELTYTNKGAKEIFKDNFANTINAEARLSYLQLNLFPIIYKPLGNRKFNPFIALGGYYSYLIKSKYRLTTDNLPAIDDEQSSKNTLKQDYGINLALGIYFKRLSIEYRVDAGLPMILDQRQTLSTIKNKTHALVLIVR